VGDRAGPPVSGPCGRLRLRCVAIERETEVLEGEPPGAVAAIAEEALEQIAQQVESR
jgi:hypothetical protein